MRKSTILFLYLSVNSVLLGLVLTHAWVRGNAGEAIFKAKADMVARLDLTDLCLVTEASYTRHVSQADRHTPFQNAPLSFEHFPSGSLVPPPPALRRIHGKMD